MMGPKNSKINCSNTRVANAYKLPIRVKAHAERSYVTSSASSAAVATPKGGEVAVQSVKHWDWNKIDTGFSKILPDKSMLFQVDISGKSFVYITVITEDGKVIADALSRTPNKSIIVGGDGMVCDATPDQTWVDTNGQCHITEMKKSEEKEIRNKKGIKILKKGITVLSKLKIASISLPDPRGSKVKKIVKILEGVQTELTDKLETLNVLTDKHGEESIVKMIERVEMLTLELESATVTEERAEEVIEELKTIASDMATLTV